MTPRRVLESGIRGLDGVLGGGISVGDLMLVVGAPGTGKTTLVCQAAFHAAARGANVVFVSTLSEPAARLVKHLRSFSFWDESLIGRRINFESIFPVVKQGVEPLVRALVHTVRARNAQVLVVDGFSTLRDLHPDSLELRTFVNELAVAMSALDCTTLLTSSNVPDMAAPTPPEFTMCDAIVELAQRDLGTRAMRSLRAWKVRGAAGLSGQHALSISNGGLSVYPRIEAYPVVTPGTDLPRSPASLGSEELDRLLGGGLPRGSGTLVVGAPGTGKTLLGLQYLLAGAAGGEAGVFVSFREASAQLLAKARAFALDAERATAEDKLSIMRVPPVDLDPDKLLAEILEELERTNARRLVIDSLLELERTLPPLRQCGVFAALADLLRARGVSSLWLREMGQRFGPELDFADSPLDVLAENVVLLRHVEHEGALVRVLSVLKMRETAHDHTIREYQLEGRGFRVLPVAESEAGLMTSISALRSEQRVKQPAAREGAPE